MLRPLLPYFLIAMQSTLHGQDSSGLTRMGDSALHAGLWETAALHYESALAAKNLTPSGKSAIAIRLAEAWARDGKCAATLVLLDRPYVSKHPDAPFWKGIALLGTGRLTEAVTALTRVLENPDSPLRDEAGFTIGSIRLALGKPDDALSTLDTLAADPVSPLGVKTRLRKMEILLDLGKHVEALAIMPDAASLGPADRPVAAFLAARLQLAGGDFPTAAAGFQTLLDQPQGQTSHRYHLAAIGLADALLGAKRPADAASFLTKFIDGHPDSPHLAVMFTRLLACLPEKPALADPILEKLAEWIPPHESPSVGLLIGVNQSADSAWPAEPCLITDLQAEAMFTRAQGLRRVDTPEAIAQARLLLDRLRLELPGTPMADRALFDIARDRMQAGMTDRAIDLLESLRETACSGETRGRAAFDEAAQAYQRGDYKNAREWFDAAAASLDRADAEAARLNSSIVTLAAAPGTMAVVHPKTPQEDPVTSDFELERALSTPAPDARRTNIEEFLTKHPEHPRVAEARLAAADAALAGAKPDLSFARAQLDTIEASPGKIGGIPPSGLAWLRLRIRDREGDPVATVEAARGFLRDFPTDPVVPDATFILGRNLFVSGSYNDARLTLEKLAASAPDSPRAQVSWLLAARSAALVRTGQSQQEALILFDKIIHSKDPAVAPLAMLEKGQLLIDMNRLQEASSFLKKWLESLKPSDPLHLPAGLLLGGAIYAQGTANPDSLTDALAVYDKLLPQTAEDAALFNRIQYLRGKTLEQIADPKDPARKREKEAFIAYYSVLEKSDTPAEWHYFELCGFRAVALLEKAGRWPAAIACAKKIASFKGPRAEEAAAHASQLQLKHMIWED